MLREFAIGRRMPDVGKIKLIHLAESALPSLMAFVLVFFAT